MQYQKMFSACDRFCLDNCFFKITFIGIKVTLCLWQIFNKVRVRKNLRHLMANYGENYSAVEMKIKRQMRQF